MNAKKEIGWALFVWLLVMFVRACFGQTSPYVTMPGIVTGGPLPTYNQNISGTASNATQLGGLPATWLISPSQTSWMTNSISEWWSADMIGATNGQEITTWTGRNGTVLTGNCVYVSQVVGNGHPGTFFDNSANMVLTNNGLLGFNFTNSGTIVCVYTFPPSSYDGNNHVAFCGNVTWQATNLTYFASDATLQGTAAYLPSTESDITGLGINVNTQEPIVNSWNNCTHVYCLSWSPTNCFIYYDGKCVLSWPTGNATYLYGALGFAGTLALGQLVHPNGFWPLNGYIEEFLVSSNYFNPQTDDRINNYFMAKYGLLKGTIMLFGDSLMAGVEAQYNANWGALLASNFPGWLIVNAAQSGSTTGECESNIMTTALSSTMPGPKVAVLWNPLINDSGYAGALGIITNQQIAIAANLRTNGIPSVLVIPESSELADTTYYPLRANYILTMSNSWSQYFNAVAPLYQDPYVGPSNSWTNVIYYGPIQDGKHFTNAGYAETFPYVQSAINYVLNPANPTFAGNTDQPPPWTGVGWQDEFQGHLYNSLGSNTWTLIR